MGTWVFNERRFPRKEVNYQLFDELVQGRSNKWEWKNCFPNLAISDECVNIMNSEKNKINNGKTKDENVKNEKGDVEHIFWDAVKICKKECKDLDGS